MTSCALSNRSGSTIARLPCTHLGSMGFNPVTGCELSHVYVENCDLSHTDLTGTVLVNCAFVACSFIKADLKKLQGQGVDFSRSDFTRADFTDAILPGANLTDCVLDWAWVVRTDVRHATLERTSFCGPQG